MADYLNFPYDPEIFQYYWGQATDPVTDALFHSGAMVSDASVAQLASTGSATYTMPYYDLLGGTEDTRASSTAAATASRSSTSSAPSTPARTRSPTPPPSSATGTTTAARSASSASWTQ